MSRNYAQTVTSIWRPESDFTTVESDAQRVYWVLKSQEDISAAGMLTLAIDRWAEYAPDTTPESIRLGIKKLIDARYVVVDERTQEILVRTFVKHDGGFRNQKRRPVIVKAALEIRSAALRSVLAVELDKVGIHIEGLDRSSDRASAARDSNLTADGPFGASSQVDSLSDTQSDTTPASRGVVVTKAVVVETPNPNPLTPTQDEIRDLADKVRAARPGWNITTVENAIRSAIASGHAMATITAEILNLASDETTRQPGRLNAPGRYWRTAATSTRDDADGPIGAHDFEPQPDDANTCVCEMPRRSRFHVGERS